MKFHRNYQQLQLWPKPDLLQRYARPESLVAVRLEPVIRQNVPQTAADLVFRADDGYLTIACALIDGPQLVAREADRFIWPALAAEALGDFAVLALEETVAPWLRSLTMGRALNDEIIRHVGSRSDREVFEAARSACFVGAAPYARCVASLAPYVFASRFAVGGRAAVHGGAEALQGTAYLAKVAGAVGYVPQGGAIGAAERWFAGLDASALVPDPTFVAIPAGSPEAKAVPEGATVLETGVDQDGGSIASRAFPLDFMFRFEALHGPPVSHFAMRVPPSPLVTGSSESGRRAHSRSAAGRVLIGLRPSWRSAPDSDVDSALALADALRKTGLHVDISGEPETPDFASYDVVHYINGLEVKAAAQFLTRAKSAGVRTVLTPAYADLGDGRAWGEATAPGCFSEEPDEASVRRYLTFMQRRALFVDTWQSLSGPPFAGYDELLRELFEAADVVIAESDPEAALLQTKFGKILRSLTVAPPLPAPALAPAETAPPVGFAGFVLVHAAVEPRANQLFAIRAAQTAGVDLVLAGDTRDMDYALRIRAIAGDRVFFVEGCSAGQTEWLYAHAGRILDVSWYAAGTARLRRALRGGIPLCASATGWGPAIAPERVIAVDPASADGIAASLLLPVSRASGFEPGSDPAERLRIILGAYLGSTGPAGTPSSSPLQGPISHV